MKSIAHEAKLKVSCSVAAGQSIFVSKSLRCNAYYDDAYYACQVLSDVEIVAGETGDIDVSVVSFVPLRFRVDSTLELRSAGFTFATCRVRDVLGHNDVPL